MTHPATDFRVHVAMSEFWKSEDNDGEVKMRVGGIATTEALDRDDERVLQEGLNFKPFLKHGYFNDDHRPGSMLGWPETAKMVKKGDKLPSGRRATRKGWWVDGCLLDNTRGREVFEDAKALERQGAPRRLGMSIEGKIQRRVGSTITIADVHEVAITKKAVNTETQLETLAKAIEAGHTDPAKDPEAASGAPLRKESLEGAPKVDVSTCKSRADWSKALSASGMSKADFEKRLSKMEGGYAARFKKAMEEEDYKEEENGDAEKAKKSFELSILETEIADLEADLAKSSGELEVLDSDTFDDPEIKDLEAVDVTGFIKSMTKGTERGFRVAAAGNEALRKMLEVQGKLTTRLAKSLIESRRDQEDLVGKLDELQKSVSELGNSPALRRGANTKPEADALGRFPKGEGEGGELPKGFVTAVPADVNQAFKKSMKAADKIGDTAMLSELSEASIIWNRAANRGAEFIPRSMADLISYQPPRAQA